MESLTLISFTALINRRLVLTSKHMFTVNVDGCVESESVRYLCRILFV